MATIERKTSAKFPLGGGEASRHSTSRVEIDLQRAIRDASAMPEQAFEVRSMRKTLESLAQALEKNGVTDDMLEEAGLPRLHCDIARLSKDNGLTTEKLASRDPGLALLALAFGGYFRQSTWANFGSPERLLTTTRNLYNGTAIEFSWAMTKLGPRASLTNTPDLGEVLETVLIERLINATDKLVGRAPAGIIIVDESASIYEYSNGPGGGIWKFNNSDFRNRFVNILGNGSGWRAPVVFVSQEIDHERMVSLHETYRNDEEHHRVARTRRLIQEAIGDAAEISAPLLAALMDSRKRTLRKDHGAIAADPEAMRDLHGAVLSQHGDSSIERVHANDMVVHVTKIGRPGELSASSLGTETGHGVPVIGFKGGLRSRPQLRIVPEVDLLETIERVPTAELTEIVDREGNFMAYYLGKNGETPSECDLQDVIPKTIGGTAIELKNVRSVEQVISDVLPEHGLGELRRE